MLLAWEVLEVDDEDKVLVTRVVNCTELVLDDDTVFSVPLLLDVELLVDIRLIVRVDWPMVDVATLSVVESTPDVRVLMNDKSVVDAVLGDDVGFAVEVSLLIELPSLVKDGVLVDGVKMLLKVPVAVMVPLPEMRLVEARVVRGPELVSEVVLVDKDVCTPDDDDDAELSRVEMGDKVLIVV